MKARGWKRFVPPAVLGGYAVFILVSLAAGYGPGVRIARNFLSFGTGMLRVLPCAFILIGLFEVWVKKETIEKYLGSRSGLMGYVWALLLACTTVGGAYVAFPVACALHAKGAKLGVIFTYVGGAAVCRVPMSIFEASFMGGAFTAVRFAVSVPLVVVGSMLLGRFLAARGYVPPGRDA